MCVVHVSLVPVIGVVGEQKTKPTQHSVQVGHEQQYSVQVGHEQQDSVQMGSVQAGSHGDMFGMNIC